MKDGADDWPPGTNAGASRLGVKLEDPTLSSLPFVVGLKELAVSFRLYQKIGQYLKNGKFDLQKSVFLMQLGDSILIDQKG